MNLLLSLLSQFTLPRSGNPFSRAPRSSAVAGRTRQRTRLSLESLEQRALLTRLNVEPLEERLVPSALSVADVTVREGPTSLGVLDPSGAASVGLDGTRDITFSSNGDLFVTGYLSHTVARFDWASQTYQPFVTAGSGGLDTPGVITIGPDGNVYVGDNGQNSGKNEILRYDGTTGAPLPAPGRTGAIFADGGGLSNVGGIAFGADGNLYAVSFGTNNVLRYQGPAGSSPGAYMGVFVNTPNQPTRLTFGPDGNLYVAGGNNSGGYVNVYNGTTGAPIGDGTFVALGSGGLQSPREMVIDSQGNYLYVVKCRQNFVGEVLRFQGPNGPNPGAFVDTYIPAGQSALNIPIGLASDSTGDSYVTQRDTAEVTRFAPAAQANFTVQLDAASTSQVSVAYTTANGTATAGTDYVQTSGTQVFPPGVTSETINVPILTVATGGPTKTFTMNLSNPVNATITRGQGTGSILNRMTKFYVCDSTPGNTLSYEYGSGGTSEEINMTSGTGTASDTDTAPRGVATTAVGSTVWVVDANKTVYVYNNGGVILGTWTPGGLPYFAQLAGIATNGSDIWIVASSAGKVYKYTGAASRLSGTQNANSTFSLNKADSNPQDIVTDGTSFWVVDGSALKVFKYTLSGSLLGSWAIDPANTHPTGITVNPTNASDVWIVDSGTLKVYDYTAAASRTSGSQNASATFALNPSDTDPQGIADPPPPEMLLPSTASSLVALDQLPVAAFHAVSTVGPSAVAGIPSVASRDVVFAMLGRESLPMPGEPSIDLTADGTLPPPRSWHGLRSEHSAVGLLDTVFVDEESTAFAIHAP